MSELHASPVDLEAYVRDALEPRAVEVLESHVAGCARCTAALQAAARFELQLSEVARAAPRPSWRSVSRLAPVVAVAAGVVALVLMPRPTPRPALDDGEPWAPDAPVVVQQVSVHLDVSELGRRSAQLRHEQMMLAPDGLTERRVALR